MIRRLILAMVAAAFVAPALVKAVEHTGYEPRYIDTSPEAVERGREVFMSHCRTCHGLRYYRGEDNRGGVEPAIDPETAARTFGTEPPDLTLMAKARGGGKEGVQYIYRLLTSYYQAPEGEMLNRAFAEYTETEGRIAMPPPISLDDPGLEKKSMDVSVFLLHTAEPWSSDSRSIGRYAIAYMVVLTGILFIVNKLTWKGTRKKIDL